MLLPLDDDGPQHISFLAIPDSALQQSIYALFSEVATRLPGNLAIVDADNVLTYQALQQKVAILAATLASWPLSKAPIALYFNHRSDLIVSMLACLALGIPYIPLDMQFPLKRSKLILQKAAPQLILTNQSLQAICKDIALPGCPLVILEQLVQHNFDFVASATAEDIAYILYTSGSTGTPKGVFQNQRGMLHDIMQYVNAAHINASDKLTMLYSGSVVGAVRDIFAALLTGAAVYMLAIRELGVSGVLAAIAQHQLTILHAVPLLYRQLVVAPDVTELLLSVRLVYLAGDRVEVSDHQLFKQVFGKYCYFYTGMGSTENSTLYRHWFVPANTEFSDGLLPVGRALPERFVRLVNEQGMPVAIGDVGEIEVTSPFMALGYWNQPELTGEKFQESALIAGARVFLTGDLGRERADGLLEFLGRKDSQIKVRGYLINPGEIETFVRLYPGVNEAAVVARYNKQGEVTILVLYWSGELQVEETELRGFLTHHLSVAQMPAKFYRLSRLPLLANYKVDRQTLLALDMSKQTELQLVEFDTATVLGRVQRIIAELLTLSSIAETDNLATLNADSLDILRLVLALEHEFAFSLNLDEFISAFTDVTALSNYIERMQ